MKQTSPMTYAMPVYEALAHTIEARLNCIKSGNDEWRVRHSETILQIVENCLPSGSGIDCGTQIDLDLSTPESLVFDVQYHHMNDGGYYDGWTVHRVIVTPSLGHKFTLRITGPNRNDIKDYLHECYRSALTEVLDATPAQPAMAS